MRMLVRLKPTHLFVVAWGSIFAAILFFGWEETWRPLQVDTLPAFSDLRTIRAAIEAVDLGYDPQEANPTDLWERSLNYPMIWVRIGAILHFEKEGNMLAFAGVMVASLHAIRL
jgi:hypothetical protein